MNIDLNEIIRVVGALYLENSTLKQENILLRGRLAEQAEGEKGKTVAGLQDVIEE